MGVQVWEIWKESITAYTGLFPTDFFTAIALVFALYYMLSDMLASSNDNHTSSTYNHSEEPLRPPVQLDEITAQELKQYDGSDPCKPLLMAIKGQIYDVTQSRIFYGQGGPYALFSGKDGSRALAKMSFDGKHLSCDVSGLGVYDIEALTDWEDEFMSKYVKVGTIKQ